MNIPKLLRLTVLVLAVWISYVTCSHAFDLNGLWASDRSACDRIFARTGNRTSIRKDSDMYGSGFIIDGKRIKGRMATCNIRSTKEDGSVIHLMTSCATDVMLSNVQFSVKVEDENTISRIFPGLEGMELRYSRCPPPSGSMLMFNRNTYAAIGTRHR